MYNYKTKKTEGYNTIELGFVYELGGMNYFSGTVKPRCYYIGALAFNVTKNNGYSSKEHMMFDDSETARACQNIIIKEVKRKNDKYHAKLLSMVDFEKYGEAIENRDFAHTQGVISKLKNA